MIENKFSGNGNSSRSFIRKHSVIIDKATSPTVGWNFNIFKEMDFVIFPTSYRFSPVLIRISFLTFCSK